MRMNRYNAWKAKSNGDPIEGTDRILKGVSKRLTQLTTKIMKTFTLQPTDGRKTLANQIVLENDQVAQLISYETHVASIDKLEKKATINVEHMNCCVLKIKKILIN